MQKLVFCLNRKWHYRMCAHLTCPLVFVKPWHPCLVNMFVFCLSHPSVQTLGTSHPSMSQLCHSCPWKPPSNRSPGLHTPTPLCITQPWGYITLTFTQAIPSRVSPSGVTPSPWPRPSFSDYGERTTMVCGKILKTAGCTMDYYSVLKKSEIMPFTATWMDLETDILSEVSQTRINII